MQTVHITVSPSTYISRLSHSILNLRLAWTGNIIKIKRSPYVPLPDQHSSMVNALSQTKLKYLCLKASLQEIFDPQTQNVIELHSALIKHANTNETTQKSVAFEQPSRVFLLQS